MIAVKLHGRLGNQMFQYAFGLSAAEAIKTRLILLRPDLEDAVLHNYFTLGSNRFLLLLRLRFARYLKPQKQIHFNNEQSPRKVILSLANSTLYTGFFQSADYFKNIDLLVREHFQIRDSYARKFQEKYSHLSSRKYIVIHTRKTDYYTHGNTRLGGEDITLDRIYYDKCLSNITNLHDYEVIVISDDIDLTKEDFKNYSNFHYESNEEIIDFQLMLHANILIISNSSFSWWGAYLNPDPNKKVYAPKYWFGTKVKTEYPVGVTSVDFDWVET